MARNLRTADFPEKRRRTLGDAVAAARRAAGFKWRTDFSRAHPDVGVSSLKLVEQGKPLVGITALQAIGRALGNHFGTWNADTPRSILEGGPIPPLDEPAPEPPAPQEEPRPGTPEWFIKLAEQLPEEQFLELFAVFARMVAERRARLRDPARPPGSGT